MALIKIRSYYFSLPVLFVSVDDKKKKERIIEWTSLIFAGLILVALGLSIASIVLVTSTLRQTSPFYLWSTWIPEIDT
jgi:hypothetical protein